MNSFSTRIVRTWNPSPLLRGIMVVLLLWSGVTLYVFEVQEHWLRISASVVYFASMFGALSLSFIKPKNLGEITISKSGIDVLLKESSENWQMSEIQDIGLYDPAREGFWEKISRPQKKKLSFSTSSGESFTYEIQLQSQQKQEELRKFLGELNLFQA
ncbi:MAG: hypothetical protein WBV11_13845 [Salegentibacter sp.]